MNKFSYYFSQLINSAPNTLIKKILFKFKYFLLKWSSKISSIIFGTEITDKRFLRNAWNSEFEFKNAEELVKYFHNRKEPKFFIAHSKQERSTPIICEYFPGYSEKVIPEANKLCKHIFNLLGSGDVNMGEKINWHCDFKTGYCWDPDKYYKDIEIPYEKADIKVPWELSRFQHFALLGEAYQLTSDEKYARDFVNQLSDWIDSNKPKFGVNWYSTMDVAIRACNWILGFYLFKDSNIITSEFSLKFLKSLYQHAKHIMSNLDYGITITSNHYLSDIVGLIYLGVMFPEFKEAEKWRVFAIKELKKEMEKQVYDDGCDFEASTCYQRLVLELFFFSTLLVVINDNNFNGENYREISQEIFGKEYTNKFYKMFDAVCHLLKPNGRMPQIGDNDNSTLHKFTKREILDMRYLLTLGAIFFKDHKFKIKEFGFSEDVLWLFGKKGYKIWQDLPENCLANIKSKAFPNAGWYIMRNDKDYMIISCGSNGQNGNGGHAHNDKLSFELCVNCEDIIVDPGSYVYTKDLYYRNLARSTLSHNTLCIDGHEQNPFNNYNWAILEDRSSAKCTKWSVNDREIIFEGIHFGYMILPEKVTHRRKIVWERKKSRIFIEDYISRKKIQKEKNHLLLINLNIAEDERIEIIKKNERLILLKNIYIKYPKNVNFKINTGFFSKGYGYKKEIKKLTFQKEVQLPSEVKIVIYHTRKNKYAF